MSVSKRLRYEVLRRENHSCRYCGATAPGVELTVDHVVPTALGGTDAPENLVAACGPCNSGKSASNPDAPMVADVAQDAIRWAQAQQVAAQQMLDRLNDRNALCAPFEKRWHNWTSGPQKERLPLPSAWMQSVDSFLSAGLPMPVLLDCIDKAMAAPRVKADDRFRYMCGIVWKKIAELRDATRAAVDGSTVQAASVAASGADVINELIGVLGLGEDEWLAFVDKAVDEPPDEDDEAHPDPTVRAMVAAVDQVVGRAFSYAVGLSQLAKALPDELYERLWDTARVEVYDYLGSDDEHDIRARFAWFLGAEFAKDYLRGLPKEERDEWLECGATYMRKDPDDPYAISSAAHYARRVKGGGGAMPDMCILSGDFGAMCPNRATNRLWFKQCGLCEASGLATCEGHSGVCDRHVNEEDGCLRDVISGQELVVDKRAVIDDPWAVKY